MTIEFDLTHFIKEMQLQHGLRSEDYGRYHSYLTNRLATLRKQVKLSNDRKKFLKKEVTAANATDERHLMLLALYAERCWTTAEAILETHQAFHVAGRGEANKPKGGVPPRDLSGKRLNKSVKWALTLRDVAAAVGSPRLKQECEAYLQETSGRCAASHGRFAEAKQQFMAARKGYYALRPLSTDAQWAVVALKVSELDDRVVFCLQQLGENPASYTPEAVHSGAGDAGSAGTTLRWNGRTLNVASIKVKDALREARSVPVEDMQAKVLEAAGPVAVGQSSKVLDLMDRRLSSYNDALAHARQDLRGAAEGSAAKVELQLIVHYFLFEVSFAAMRRTLFLAEVYSRRFHATEKVVLARYRQQQQQQQQKRAGGKAGRKSEISPAQFASPLEVVRLYEAAADAVEQMELLPGVADRDDVVEMAAAAQAGKLIYTGESWRLVKDTVRAEQCYRAATAVLKDATTMPEAQRLRELAEAASLRMSAENVLSSSSSVTAGAKASEAVLAYLTDATPGQAAVAQAIVRFPPDYQATACKPAFVDIASTYVEFPLEEMEETAAAAATPATTEKTTSSSAAGAAQRKDGKATGQKQGAGKAKAAEAEASTEQDGKKWGWKWGWGS